MAKSPFNSFATSKILSELFNTSTVCVYGLYLRHKKCKKWPKLRSQNTWRWTAFWCRRRWPSQTQWHFPGSQCKSTVSGRWSPGLKSFKTSLQLRRMSNHDLSAANRVLLQLKKRKRAGFDAVHHKLELCSWREKASPVNLLWNVFTCNNFVSSFTWTFCKMFSFPMKLIVLTFIWSPSWQRPNSTVKK